MHYFAIDFETANSSRASACALGIIEVKDGNILNKWDYLINPEEHFDEFNIYIHGISSDMVKDKPTFPNIWSEVKQILTNQIIIAHNASFDISVLRHVLNKYDIEYPTFRYSCTRILSKKTWTNLINYKLGTIAEMLDIKFIHHNACEDAIASSKILEEIISINSIEDFEELHNNLKVRIGMIFPNSYKPCEVKGSSYSIKEYIKPKDIIPELDEFDINHPLYNKGIAFTGTLTSMTRKDAAQLAVNKGAFYCGTVNKNTNYLVIGVQDYSRFADGLKSSKLIKAEGLISKNQDLEIIDENEFLTLL